MTYDYDDSMTYANDWNIHGIRFRAGLYRMVFPEKIEVLGPHKNPQHNRYYVGGSKLGKKWGPTPLQDPNRPHGTHSFSWFSLKELRSWGFTKTPNIIGIMLGVRNWVKNGGPPPSRILTDPTEPNSFSWFSLKELRSWGFTKTPNIIGIMLGVRNWVKNGDPPPSRILTDPTEPNSFSWFSLKELGSWGFTKTPNIIGIMLGVRNWVKNGGPPPSRILTVFEDEINISIYVGQFRESLAKVLIKLGERRPSLGS